MYDDKMAQDLLLSLSLSLSLLSFNFKRNALKISEAAPVCIKMPGLSYVIELEMQNEELRRTQRELQAERDKFSDLYDFAPVGCFTTSEKGTVFELYFPVTRDEVPDKKKFP